ncbi:hypothetical protein FOA52_003069 [Chlamydomonas sp. UWO 241]|nr:hypothetical protein FOA52_003069 [Chlamydomonas sp. UWO 241]
MRVAAVVLLLACAWAPKPVKGKTALNPTFLYGSVPQAQACLDRVWDEATLMLNRDAEVSNCLRMAFHDAGTYNATADEGGANGSIMNELDPTAFPANGGLDVAGAVAVYASGGPQCPLLMGRQDVSPGGTDSATALPDPCHDTGHGELVSTFAGMGFSDPVTALTVLSGAHNIGSSRVTGTDFCSRGVGALTRNNDRFDGHYYTEVVERTGRKGWFDSDRALNNDDAATAPLMRAFSANHQAFLNAWCAQYAEMSLLGVDPAPFSALDGWLATVDPAVNPPNNNNPGNGGGGRGNGGGGGGGNGGGGNGGGGGGGARGK